MHYLVPSPAPPTHLVVAIIQRQDQEPLLAALRDRSYAVTLLDSTGGFLGRANTTLLLALAAWQIRVVKLLLHAHCPTREEWYQPAFALPDGFAMAPLPVSVGGATIFIVPILRYERLLPPG